VFFPIEYSEGNMNMRRQYSDDAVLVGSEHNESPRCDLETGLLLPRPLRVLTRSQSIRIDRMLSELSSYGEIRLVKVKGRLRYIVRLESEEAP